MKYLKFIQRVSIICMLALTFVFGSISGGWAGNSQADWGKFVTTNPPATAPEVPFYDSENNPLRLSKFKGRVVLINFWATWCQACITEMPELDLLQSIKGNDGLVVLAIAQNSGRAAVIQKFLDGRNIENLEVYFDHGRLLGLAFGQTMLPTSILIDANGFEVGRLVGAYKWSSAKTMALIDHYLPQ